MATFGPEGPLMCSGLPTVRYRRRRSPLNLGRRTSFRRLCARCIRPRSARGKSSGTAASSIDREVGDANYRHGPIGGCWGYQSFYVRSPRHIKAAIRQFRAACVAWRKQWPGGSAPARPVRHAVEQSGDGDEVESPDALAAGPVRVGGRAALARSTARQRLRAGWRPGARAVAGVEIEGRIEAVEASTLHVRVGQRLF